MLVKDGIIMDVIDKREFRNGLVEEVKDYE